MEWTSHKSCQAFLHNAALEQNFQFWQARLRILKESIYIRNSRENPRDDRGNIRSGRDGPNIRILELDTQKARYS